MKQGKNFSKFYFLKKLPKKSDWILEFTQGPHSAHLFQVKKRIVCQTTDFQKADIVELFEYGKALFLDDRLQVTEKDEFLYHESIVHPALIIHPNPEKVLIIGGADGGAAYQVLKHRSVKKVFLVELDSVLTKLCKKHFVSINRGVFKKPKLTLINEDGRRFLKKTKERFDVVISDLTAPLLKPPAYLLFTKEFYKLVYDRLKDDGIFSLQADGVNCFSNRIFTAIYHTVGQVFPIIKASRVFIPSYDDSWGFIIASKKYDPEDLMLQEIRKRIKARGLRGLKYYDENIHKTMFVLPKHLRKAIKEQKKTIKEKNPLIVFQ